MRVRTSTKLLGALLIITVALWIISGGWNFGVGFEGERMMTTLRSGGTGAVYVSVGDGNPRALGFLGWAKQSQVVGLLKPIGYAYSCTDHMIPGIGFTELRLDSSPPPGTTPRSPGGVTRTFHVHYWVLCLLLVLLMSGLHLRHRMKIRRAARPAPRGDAGAAE